MTFKVHKQHTENFTTLTMLLGIDQDSLLDYLNWCLLQHLVTTLSQDKQWIIKIKTDPKAISIFKESVEKRTKYKWDNDNIIELYERVKASTEKHYRQRITYEELLRLLVNSPLKCAICGKTPPEITLHIDHKFPASKGGSSEFENLQFLCAEDNLTKSNKLYKSELWLKLEFLRQS
jgi:5-methylcytosine-specific restriction endonuclease McrA